MKKIFLITCIIIMPYMLGAQSAFDALRYSQNFYTGTARSAALGNAVSALGGDFGSLSINPAGSAVYPYSEFVFTPSLHNSLTKSDYLSNASEEGFARAGVTNIGYVSSIKLPNYTGLVGISFGIGYNGLNKFNERLSVSGTTDQSSWLASLAYNTNGVHATGLDWNDQQNPFHYSSASWKSILAWNTSLLDTIPGTHGSEYLGVTEAVWGNDIGIPGPLRQNFTRKNVGNTGEYVINFGLNFSHRFFVGANIGVQNIYYESWEEFSESVVNIHDFMQTQFSDFTHTYHQKSVGTGVNFKVGFIFLPVQNLRLGASISTPTWMRINEEWEEGITANFSDGYHQHLTSPLGKFEYNVEAPFRWNAGFAYTFGALGALSFDYEQVAFNKIFMSGTTTSSNPFNNDNSYIKKEFQNTHNIRTGLEVNLNDEFSLRGGYAFYGNPEKNIGDHTQIASLGIGLRWDSLFTDLTFMQRFTAKKENFALYDDVYDGGYVVYPAPVGSQTTSRWSLLLSIGLRF